MKAESEDKPDETAFKDMQEIINAPFSKGQIDKDLYKALLEE
jgi:hypothetical protein